MESLCDDLAAEHEALDAIVSGLSEDEWCVATPAEGWSIKHQISHLWFFDVRAALSMTDPDAFSADTQSWIARGVDPSVEAASDMSGAELLESWRQGRRHLVDVARVTDSSRRVPWYGPAMAAKSSATARLMETWAHGYDIADAIAVTPPASSRLRHIAHIGVRARPYAYLVNQRPIPDTEVRVELTAPDGETWIWNEGATGESLVQGSALDFCLVVTQRRHLDDTTLEIRGDAALDWMPIAQAFAGPPGSGRQPLGS
jgi:uncharacterized protein (TIGR03084 family)